MIINLKNIHMIHDLLPIHIDSKLNCVYKKYVEKNM